MADISQALAYYKMQPAAHPQDNQMIGKLLRNAEVQAVAGNLASGPITDHVIGSQDDATT